MGEELVRELRPERDRPLGPLRLRCFRPPVNPRLAHLEPGTLRVGQVDPAPAQTRHLPTPQAGVEHGQKHRACLLDPRPLGLVVLISGELGERTLDPPHLGRGEDRQPPPWLPRTLHQSHRVRYDEPPPHRRLDNADSTFKWRLIVRGCNFARLLVAM